MTELKPCPFCGSEKLRLSYGVPDRYCVICDKCGAISSFMNNGGRKTCKEAWNRRAEDGNN